MHAFALLALMERYAAETPDSGEVLDLLEIRGGMHPSV